MFLKNRNISSKIMRSKVTDYAALTCANKDYNKKFPSMVYNETVIHFKEYKINKMNTR